MTRVEIEEVEEVEIESKCPCIRKGIKCPTYGCDCELKCECVSNGECTNK